MKLQIFNRAPCVKTDEVLAMGLKPDLHNEFNGVWSWWEPDQTQVYNEERGGPVAYDRFYTPVSLGDALCLFRSGACVFATGKNGTDAVGRVDDFFDTDNKDQTFAIQVEYGKIWRFMLGNTGFAIEVLDIHVGHSKQVFLVEFVELSGSNTRRYAGRVDTLGVDDPNYIERWSLLETRCSPLGWTSTDGTTIGIRDEWGVVPAWGEWRLAEDFECALGEREWDDLFYRDPRPSILEAAGIYSVTREHLGKFRRGEYRHGA